jgi:hypothetical protein
MREIYFRLQRATIYDPTTIDDLPFELLKKCLSYLVPRGRIDLAESSLVSLAWTWRLAAQEHLRSLALLKQAKIESGLCGLLIHSFVLGFKSFSLSILNLSFKLRGTANSCYDILETLLSRCSKILNLALTFFNFGDDPSNIRDHAILKERFYLLTDLKLVCSRGNSDVFFKHAPILSLIEYCPNLNNSQCRWISCVEAF